MRTIELPRETWSAKLNEFTSAHGGWLVSVDVLGPALGAQPEIDNLPLLAVSAEHTPSGAMTIRISAARSAAEHISHTITEPTRVEIERREDGADVALRIASADGLQTILRFRVAALPETVDGLPPRG
jgi:uncharacterized protein DUF5335